MEKHKTILITGASQGIGAGLVNSFVERGYNVVATSRHVSRSDEIKASSHLALVDGDIADPATAKKVAETAIKNFGSIDALVNNAGISRYKPFAWRGGDATGSMPCPRPLDREAMCCQGDGEWPL